MVVFLLFTSTVHNDERRASAQEGESICYITRRSESVINQSDVFNLIHPLVFLCRFASVNLT